MNFLQAIIDFRFLTHFDMDGILLVNKPKGPTSFDIIRILRRVTGERKIGHTGTLDPEARGLLIVVFGKARKLVERLQRLDKEYIARILLGVSTDTDDISGKVINREEFPAFSSEIVKKVLTSFKGNIKQQPPRFSAVKVKGQRAYKLAREGKKFQLKERNVFIHNIDIIYYSHPYLKIVVKCSYGTYIRALARDIGIKLKTYGTLYSLLRSRIGPWHLTESINVMALKEGKNIQERLLPPDVINTNFPQIMSSFTYKEVLAL